MMRRLLRYRDVPIGLSHFLENVLKMEMNWGTAIIGIFALALCALPFILDRFSRSRKEKQLLGILQGAAHQHDCKVDIHGTCGRIALGLDEGKKALFCYAQRADRDIAEYVDLTQMRSCRTVKVGRSGHGQHSDASIEQLALCFAPKDTNAKEKRFELYYAGTGTYLTDELEFADKWTKLINERL